MSNRVIYKIVCTRLFVQSAPTNVFTVVKMARGNPDINMSHHDSDAEALIAVRRYHENDASIWRMQPRFTDKLRQDIYKICRLLGNDTSSEFYKNGKPYTTGGVHRSVYWKGRRGKKLNGFFPRNSIAYVCWAAGQDDFRADLVRRKRVWKRKLYSRS